jgi:hypothetical protein
MKPLTILLSLLTLGAINRGTTEKKPATHPDVGFSGTLASAKFYYSKDGDLMQGSIVVTNQLMGGAKTYKITKETDIRRDGRPADLRAAMQWDDVGGIMNQSGPLVKNLRLTTTKYSRAFTNNIERPQ